MQNLSESEIHQIQENAKNKDSDDYYNCSITNFFETRPAHFFRFRNHFLKKSFNAGPGSFYPIDALIEFIRYNEFACAFHNYSENEP